ncbi:MAG: hypothetical protein KF811_04755 [Dokdonella sp.]|nr:hypothetical protein [Dokdonella sp.]
MLYDEMLSDIREACSVVRLESYILADDEIGGKFFSALESAGRERRSASIRADYIGSWGAVSATRLRTLRSAGVRWQWSRPWSWRRPFALNRRNHRKLLIIDERVAYVGGFNIHRQSSLRATGAERWRDTHVRITGPLVLDAIKLFERFPRRPRMHWEQFPGGTHLVPNDSRRCRHLLRCAYNAHFQSSRERIWVTTPYFVPDSRTQAQLCDAARRGVDVRILVPGKSDVGIAAWAARAAYAHMLKSGVRIWEYQTRMLHAKTLLVDRTWATVGTANFDYRSFFLNDELNLVVEEAGFNAQIASQFEQDLSESVEIDGVQWKERARHRAIAELVGWWARRWL